MFGDRISSLANTAIEERVRILEGESGDLVEIRDRSGATRIQFDLSTDSAVLYAPGCELQVRPVNGKLEISCSSGIRFVTPGMIEFASGQGVRMTSGETTCQVTPSGMKMAGEEVTVSADSVSLTGGALKARMERITMTVGKLEQFADRIFQQAKNSYQRIEGLWHTRAGRVRTEAAASHMTQAAHVRIVAEQEARIQASSINLG